jgi:hypothetical protein
MNTIESRSGIGRTMAKSSGFRQVERFGSPYSPPFPTPRSSREASDAVALQCSEARPAARLGPVHEMSNGVQLTSWRTTRETTVPHHRLCDISPPSSKPSHVGRP